MTDLDYYLTYEDFDIETDEGFILVVDTTDGFTVDVKTHNIVILQPTQTELHVEEK